MSSNYFLTVPHSDTGDEETYVFEPDGLAAALAAFFKVIEDGAEHAKLEWSA